MSAKIGLDAKLYYHDGTAFVEIATARDVTLNLEKGEADTSTRGNDGWRTRLATLKDASIDFEILADSEDAGYQALADAFFNDTQIEMLVMDGDKADTTSQGLRAFMGVFTFSRNEPLEEALTINVSVKPAPAATNPQWVNGPVT
jgi:predicted secreted protein